MFNKIKEFFNSNNKPMAKVDSFKPVDVSNPEAVINFLMSYKKQNPEKFALKKEALFKQFGISLEEEKKVDPIKDETDIQLETLKAKAKK